MPCPPDYVKTDYVELTSCLPPDADEKFQLGNEVNSHAALAVISGLIAGAGLAALRSVLSLSADPRIPHVISIISGISAMMVMALSLYAALVFSLLRYYEHAALGKQRHHAWHAAKKQNNLPCIIRMAFNSFLGSICLLVFLLFALPAIRFETMFSFENLYHKIFFLAIWFGCSFLIVCLFSWSVNQFYQAAAVIFMPVRTIEHAESPEHLMDMTYHPTSRLKEFGNESNDM